MSDKKEQLQKSPPEAIEEVEERSDEDDGEPKSATTKAKSKAADAKNAKAPPRKKSLPKTVRGVSVAAALGGMGGGGVDDYVTKN